MKAKMIMKKLVSIMGLSVIPLLFTACEVGQPLGLAATPTPASSPTPVPGIGVPVISGKWEITLTNAREEKELSYGVMTITHTTPAEGFTFLVVDGDFRLLQPTEKLSTQFAAVLTEDGKIISAAGGSEGSLMGYQLRHFELTGWEGGGLSAGLEYTVGFVFVLEEDEINQNFKFQFQEGPLIPFSVGQASATPSPTP